MTYEQSIQRLESIVQKLEHGEMPIDEMATQLREAQALLSECRKQLYSADEAVKQILEPEQT